MLSDVMVVCLMFIDNGRTHCLDNC